MKRAFLVMQYKYMYFVLLVLVQFSARPCLADGLIFFRQQELKLDRFGNCSRLVAGSKDAKLLLRSVRIFRRDHRFSIFATVKVTEDINDPLRLELLGRRCSGKDAPDTCEDYQNLKIAQFCSMMDPDKFTPWASILRYIEPPLKCPFRKGIYYLNNGTVDVRALSIFPSSNDFYWKVTSKLYNGVNNKLIACVYTESSLYVIH